MKKIFILIAMLILSMQSIFAEDTVLHGSVQYTVESAKKIAFDGLDLRIDKKLLEPYLIDENNKENRAALKNKTQIKGRSLMSFQTAKGLVRGYALVYDDKPEYSFYYSTSGYLIAVDVDEKTNENIYPHKVGKYNSLTGNLVSIGLYISDEEQYVYSKNGKLMAHWVGFTGYNEKGRPIAVRDYSDIIPSEIEQPDNVKAN